MRGRQDDSKAVREATVWPLKQPSYAASVNELSNQA